VCVPVSVCVCVCLCVCVCMSIAFESRMNAGHNVWLKLS